MKHRLQTLLKHKLQWLVLLTALLGVSQRMLGTDYYYRGDKNSWGADKMTAHSSGYFHYYYVNSASNFKISKGTDSWDYNKSKQQSGYRGTNVSMVYGTDDNCKCNGAGYILIFLPGTKWNTGTNPIICAATSIPTVNTVTVRVKKLNISSAPRIYAWDTSDTYLCKDWSNTDLMSDDGTYYYATVDYFTSTFSVKFCNSDRNKETSNSTGKNSSVCYTIPNSDVSGTLIESSNVQPSVTTTNSASNLTTEGADIGGNISSEGTSSACATATLSRRGVRVYSNEACTTEVSGSPFYDTTNSTGDYAVTVTGLNSNTQYWYRAYAKNNNSSNNEVTDTSHTYTFTTLSDCTPPTFTAPSATSWCDGSPGTLTVSTKTSGSTIEWWETESSSTPLSSGDSYTPASFTATTTYYISATIDACTSARQSVTVTKIALPSLSLGLSPSTVYPWDVATITATTTCTTSTLDWKLYQGETLISTGAGSGTYYTFKKTDNTHYTLKGISSSGSGSSVTYTVKVDGNNGTCNAAQATQNITISAAASEDCGD